MELDERSFRVALTADRYVNPPPGGPDGLAVLAETGWGVIQLPAADYPAAVAERILAEVAEQVREFDRHGYDLVLVGDGGGLAEALAAAGVAVPDQVIPAGPAELRAFLEARPLPAALRRPSEYGFWQRRSE
jgi:hypothetical protein